jgi:16S rRNA (cytidine1402-2'-O)-methyltransferase
MDISASLYIVATPIGNLGDITLRAIEVLREVDCIAAEDTRHSKKLLAHFDIKKPMLSLHNYNENEQSKVLLKHLQKGENIALISDAGTPLISDPGFCLVKIVREAGVTVIPIPGPCAAITALCASGLPTDKFIFEGFLPAKSSAREKRLIELKTEPRSIIFYEAPHRVISLITELVNIFGENRSAVIARELTKKFETIYSADLATIKTWLESDKHQQKGEFVILVHGAEKMKEEINEKNLQILKILLTELPVKQAASLTAKITGISKNKLYKAAMEL